MKQSGFGKHVHLGRRFHHTLALAITLRPPAISTMVVVSSIVYGAWNGRQKALTTIASLLVA